MADDRYNGTELPELSQQPSNGEGGTLYLSATEPVQISGPGGGSTVPSNVLTSADNYSLQDSSRLYLIPQEVKL